MSAGSDARALSLGRLNMVLPGSYAWLATVAVPVAERETSWLARGFAGLALVALWLGPWLFSGSVARSIGILGFVGCCAATWLELGAVLDIGKVEPVRAALGSLGWMLFAFGWGKVRGLSDIPEQDPHVLPGAPLKPRRKPGVRSTAVLALSVAAALAPLGFAWGVKRPLHALLAHATAVVCAMFVVSVGAQIAVAIQNERVWASPALRLNRATRPLSLLGLALVVGFAWVLVR